MQCTLRATDLLKRLLEPQVQRIDALVASAATEGDSKVDSSGSSTIAPHLVETEVAKVTKEEKRRKRRKRRKMGTRQRP